MEISKSRRQVLMTTAMIGIAGCSGNSSNNQEENTNRSGTTEEPTESTEAPTEEPTQYKRKWTGSEGVTSIDIHGGNIYALIGTKRPQRLSSLAIQTGKQKWSKELKYSSQTYITATDSYIITPNSVRNRTDGSIQWRGTDRFNTDFEPRSVVENALYAITSKSPEDSRNLTKFNLENGSIDWEASYSNSVTQSDFGLHVLQPNDNNTNQLVTKDQSSGEDIYTKQISSNSSLIGTSNDSLIGLRLNDQSAFLFALDPESGDSLWETEINGGFPMLGSRGRKSHILSENIMYSPVWDRENNRFTVQSHNLSNGELRWKQDISLSIIEFSLGMAKNKNTIFFGKFGQGGTKLVLLNSNNGEIQSTNPVQTMPLTVIDGNLLGMVPSGEHGQKLGMFEPVDN